MEVVTTMSECRQWTSGVRQVLRKITVIPLSLFPIYLNGNHWIFFWVLTSDHL
jgi:hypothetical protein